MTTAKTTAQAHTHAPAPPRSPAVGTFRPRRTAPWQADPYTDALRTGRGPLFLRRSDGWLLPLEVERWCAEPDSADLTVLERCRGTVLDIGCGPGRLVAALASRGRPSLGIDISPAAVSHAVRAGGSALVRSVFDPLPREGGWHTALLMDGNIGIGGDPLALLSRLTGVVRTAGSLIVETASAGTDAELDERVRVRVDNGNGASGEAFSWARVGARALIRHARATGWTPSEQWTAAGRRFVALERPG
ncbi:methyltransferase domain-containing protein [Streptomyces scopuliridis]|uniref:Methyltransferase domain-containing protein n=1 Tax=Streptomyces scopuliridis TaxID=452529 RepID=A0ACD4ZF74_9ACTN|nr:class I SAM-dependent methyltransferase [Streptomyces scopuliridis]WSB32424.1 methyltransferase domain-containing protein [Streptomyces scopuliridis]WSB96671.1 methyltransferase domain-containing protein [Streptomyces scopuliridis]WSC09625.1 methyltransferase domain-containing protein [Streptomyces scopuliridis]